jgi:prepilin-type processing-associated H-X9-DG protein
VFACPGYDRLSKIAGRKYARGAQPGAIFAGAGAYGYNFSETYWAIPNYNSRGLGGKTGSESGLGTPRKENDVVNPSEMIAVTDSIMLGREEANDGTFTSGYLFVSYNALSVPLFMGVSTTKAQEAGRSVYPQRHSGRFGTLFCDGHVESLRTDQLFDPRKPEVRQRWHYNHFP